MASRSSGAALPKAEEDRLMTLWVTLPNYVRIVYGYVPPWERGKP